MRCLQISEMHIVYVGVEDREGGSAMNTHGISAIKIL